MKKVLVVDDDPVVLRLLETKLGEEGYAVIRAENGLSGLAAVKKEKPDLIVADYLMPKMDGFAFYKKLKQDKVFSRIPVLILTERAQMEESFRAVGAEVFVTKPFMMEGLLLKIAEMLRKSDKEKSAYGFILESHQKVLVSGTSKTVIQDIVLQLQSKGCLTETAMNGMETLNEALDFDPDIILIDMAMDDTAGHKLIRVLRQIPQMKSKVVLVYYFQAEVGMGNLTLVENIGSEEFKRSSSLNAGATEYFGRFNPATFLDRMDQYLFPEL